MTVVIFWDVIQLIGQTIRLCTQSRVGIAIIQSNYWLLR